MSVTNTYYLFTALLSVGLGCLVTSYTLFLSSIGLSFGEISLINTIYWLTVVAAELPTGMFADGRSRAFSLKIGAVFQALGAFVYICATGFWSAVIAEMTLAIGSAFVSGAGTAWIADALAREGRMDNLRRVYATESLVKSVCMLTGGFVGPIVAMIGYRFAWLPFVVAGSIACWIAHARMNGKGEPLEYVSELHAFHLSLTMLLRSRALVWLMCAMLVFGAVVAFNQYWALYFESMVGQAGLSWIWVVLYLGVMCASQFARRTKIAQGSEAGFIALAVLLSGLGLGFVALVPMVALALPALFMHEIGRGLFEPFTGAFVQHRIHTSYRATFGSLQSFVGRTGFGIAPLFIWFAIRNSPDSNETIASVWIACSAILVFGACALWLTRPRR